MSGGQLPLPISQAIQYLRTPPNLQTVGLFRKVPSMTTLDVCKSAYDSKIPINLSQWPESTILAGSIIKNYLRCLKYPVFPSGMYDAIKNCPKLEDEAIQYIKDTILPKLREDHPDGGFTVVLLEEILSLLRDVAAFKGQ